MTIQARNLLHKFAIQIDSNLFATQIDSQNFTQQMQIDEENLVVDREEIEHGIYNTTSTRARNLPQKSLQPHEIHCENLL